MHGCDGWSGRKDLCGPASVFSWFRGKAWYLLFRTLEVAGRSVSDNESDDSRTSTLNIRSCKKNITDYVLDMETASTLLNLSDLGVPKKFGKTRRTLLMYLIGIVFSMGTASATKL